MPKYNPIDPTGTPTERTTWAPSVFCARAALWEPILGGSIDEMSSDPRTLNLLSDLIRFTEPQTIVEVGTYRGWGTATFAETLRTYNLPGHVWSCDPVDHGVSQMLRAADLFDCVTLVVGTFEDLLKQLGAPINFCYIDASCKTEASLRLRYTRLALEYLAPDGLIAVDDAAGDWKGAKSLRKLASFYLPQHRGLALITA